LPHWISVPSGILLSVGTLAARAGIRSETVDYKDG